MAILNDARRSACKIGDVQADAEVRTVHGKDGVLTEHAVESGSPISDHYRVDPAEIEIEGVVTDTPLSALAFPGAASVNALQSAASGDDAPSAAAMAAIEAYFDSAEIITIVTRRKTYENMVLTHFTFEDTARSANRLEFVIRARQLRIVDTATGAAIVRPKATTHQKKKSAGQAATKEAPPATTGKSRSILASVFGIGS